MRIFGLIYFCVVVFYFSICRVQSGVTVTTIYSFNATNGGFFPHAGLVQGEDGYLYGTAMKEAGVDNGYDNTGFGTIFRISTNGSFTKLFSFSGTNGYRPLATLLKGADGSFYGTTALGGSEFQGALNPWGMGTVFRITTGSVFTVLHHFRTSTLAVYEGYPSGSLVHYTNGEIYGTTSGETVTGVTTSGSVFKITTNGQMTTLFAFGNTNGARPWGGLVLGNDGNFYGTTSAGASNDMGTNFRITPQGDLVTLTSFAGTNGNRPGDALMKGLDGAFYGTTSRGGKLNRGTVFRLTASGILTTLFSFDDTNGFSPAASLVQAPNGILYGTTQFGGTNTGDGVIFSITTNGFFSKLHDFTDSATPNSELVLASDGNYYGTTDFGGTDHIGNIFRLTITDEPPVLSTVTAQDQMVTFGWNAMVGRLYQVQFKTNLAQTNWSNLGGPMMATNSPTVISDSTIGDWQRFYRVSLLP